MEDHKAVIGLVGFLEKRKGNIVYSQSRKPESKTHSHFASNALPVADAHAAGVQQRAELDHIVEDSIRSIGHCR